MKKESKTVEEYIVGFPIEMQVKLEAIREIIKKNAPFSEERISYGMPAYFLKGKPLVYFGGYPKHIGFYATPSGHQKFKEKLADYKNGKGSVQFPNDRTLPLKLISEMVKFRVSENLQS